MGIEVDGKPVSHWNAREYRRHVSVVAQDVKLFTGTIKENLLYGLSDAERAARGFDSDKGDEELIRFCKMADIWDDIKLFPLLLETRVGTKGVKLSGGQTQQIAITRALVKQPKMLILDEAISALDAITQKKVAANIAEFQAKAKFTIV